MSPRISDHRPPEGEWRLAGRPYLHLDVGSNHIGVFAGGQGPSGVAPMEVVGKTFLQFRVLRETQNLYQSRETQD